MTRRQRDSFESITTEGALLPVDLLHRIAQEDADLGGLTPADYHLSGERIREAIARSWSRLLAAWRHFDAGRAALGENDLGTSITRERWLQPLFQELGYGRLATSGGFEIEGKSYPVSHLWNRLPIHLVGFRVNLDRRTPGAAGAARASPHGLVQELLNRRDDFLWGVASNGFLLRILRDSRALTRQAYVEFDLESMMRGEQYADFALLWLVLHESRVEGNRPEECWLEKWTRAAAAQGTRALDQLRDGVTRAIETLGRGFLALPANAALRDKLQRGELTTQDYYRELLRLVYRLLFLFVAEDRGLLLDPKAAPMVRERFQSWYSTARLRRLSERRRGGSHVDLWRSLRLVMGLLDEGAPALGLPALGSFLWSADATPDLVAADLANRDILEAIRNLAFTQDGSTRRAIDWRNLGSEELGSVYESLLELHPRIAADSGEFDLYTASGHERKTTGSYYTPSSLVDCLLDSALDPVLAEAAKSTEAEKTILTVKICDPACGSGHFLIAAAHRIAKRLASVRTGDEEPSPEATRTALRDVVGHCIYGVDLNPMAAELCKVALWMEAIEPGKPLSFLDHRIKIGNSLLGTTPRLMKEGIPDEAYEPIEGDDKEVARDAKKRNKEERTMKLQLLRFADTVAAPMASYGSLSSSMSSLDRMPDVSLSNVRDKEAAFRRFVSSPEYFRERLRADAWCAAFFWRKVNSAPIPVTQDVMVRLARVTHEVAAPILAEIERLSSHYQFFHWHLEFPEVFRPEHPEVDESDQQTGWAGGFDLVLGNPPWDTLSPDQREFFRKWVHDLRSMAPLQQRAEIDRLLRDPVIKAAWTEHRRDLFALVHFLKLSGVYKLFSEGNLGKGDFNIYRMFVELALRCSRPLGFAALIVPGGLYGGANASAIRHYLLDRCQLQRLYGLINIQTDRGWFPDVDIDRFAAFAARKGGRTEFIAVQFGIRDTADLARPPILIDANGIRNQSPETYAIPDVRDVGHVSIARKMHGACPALGDDSAGPPIRHYQSELHMGNDRDLFTTDLSGLPVYEGRMIDHFDHRAKTYASGHGRSADWIERSFGDPQKTIVPQWRVLRERIPSKLGNRCDSYRIGFADVASPRNERSLVATLIPPGTICGDKVPTLDFGIGNEWFFLPWLAVANAFVVDWLARARLTAPKMAFSLLDNIPFPRPALDDAFVSRVGPLVLRLSCTSNEMTEYWNRMASFGFVDAIPSDEIPRSALLDPSARACARAELDALVACDVFDLSRDELAEIMETFDVLKRREEKSNGEFTTKRLILEALESVR